MTTINEKIKEFEELSSKKVHNNIAHYRNELNISQREAAKDLEITQPQFSNYENTDTPFDIKYCRLYKIAQYLNVSIEDLIFEKE